MSCNYADGLSPYHDKGQLGLEERFDTAAVIEVKVNMLAKWINQSKHVVAHTGAGISTSAGIPDFRGPNGVWTLEAKGKKPTISTDFNEAMPTTTHMALARLVEAGKVKYVVSQNIDGLHLRSGLARQYLSELHGNMFVEQCGFCSRQFVRSTPVPTVGQKNLQIPCPTVKPNGRPCRGRMHDTILDWEHSLPENDLAMADFHSCLADLSIALGTTMQIIPSGSLPLYTKKTGGKLVIINLQPTKHDTKADLLIRGYVDEVMALLLKQLSLRVPKYSSKNDPTCQKRAPGEYLEWTITNEATAEMRRIYEEKCGSKEAKKRLEVIDEEDIPIAERLQVNRKHKSNDSDSDLEVVAEIKKKRGRPRKNPVVTPAAVPAPTTPKLTIKKNVTPSKTKYEIVTPEDTKRAKVEIVPYSDGVECDLEMVCESDDEDPVPITTNFRLYLENDTIFKREDSVDVKKEEEEHCQVIANKEDIEMKTDEKMDVVKLDESKSDSAEANNESVEEVSKNEENDVEITSENSATLPQTETPAVSEPIEPESNEPDNSSSLGTENERLPENQDSRVVPDVKQDGIDESTIEANPSCNKTSAETKPIDSSPQMIPDEPDSNKTCEENSTASSPQMISEPGCDKALEDENSIEGCSPKIPDEPNSNQAHPEEKMVESSPDKASEETPPDVS